MELNNKNRFELSGTVTEITIGQEEKKPSKIIISQVADNGYESKHEVCFFQSINFKVGDEIEVMGKLNTYRNEAQNGSIYYNLSIVAVAVKILSSIPKIDGVPF